MPPWNMRNWHNNGDGIGIWGNDVLEANGLDGLEKLAELKRSGVLTDQEFEAAKHRILRADEVSAPTISSNDESSLSTKWQQRFKFFDDYGGPGQASFKRAFRSLSLVERHRILFNWWAFFFGPLYFLRHGLFRRAITLTAVAVSTSLVVVLLGAPDSLRRGLGFGVSGMFAGSANYALYLKARGKDGWNPVPIFWSSARNPGAVMGGVIAILALLGAVGLWLNGDEFTGDDTVVPDFADTHETEPSTQEEATSSPLPQPVPVAKDAEEDAPTNITSPSASLGTLVPTPLPAHTKPARCEFRTPDGGGFKGRCQFGSFGGDGSFSLSPDDGQAFGQGGSIISLKMTGVGRGIVTGTGKLAGSYGNFVRSENDRACWVGEANATTICVWAR